MEGRELKELRRNAGFSGKRLAEELDIAAATLSNYENGKSEIPRKIELAVRYLCEPAFASGQEPPERRLVNAIREIVNDKGSDHG